MYLLRSMLGAALALLLLFPSRAAAQQGDRAICNRIFARSFERKLIEKPIGAVVAEIGRSFIDAPYVAGSLDSTAAVDPGHEPLVINLRAFDCVTLVENSLALARSVKKNMLTFDAYRNELETIRYRDGKRTDYISRLHYFLDWIGDNVRKGIVRDVTEEIGGRAVRKRIDFMSEHRTSYPALAHDTAVAAIRGREKELSGREWHIIPKSDLAALSPKIETGDIIAVATTIEGLDVSHTGIAVKENDGTVRLLHAPTVGKNVQITSVPLADYLQKNSKQSGVVVLRPVEPK